MLAPVIGRCMKSLYRSDLEYIQGASSAAFAWQTEQSLAFALFQLKPSGTLNINPRVQP